MEDLFYMLASITLAILIVTYVSKGITSVLTAYSQAKTANKMSNKMTNYINEFLGGEATKLLNEHINKHIEENLSMEQLVETLLDIADDGKPIVLNVRQEALIDRVADEIERRKLSNRNVSKFK